jgi:hypothetical protein
MKQCIMNLPTAFCCKLLRDLITNMTTAEYRGLKANKLHNGFHWGCLSLVVFGVILYSSYSPISRHILRLILDLLMLPRRSYSRECSLYQTQSDDDANICIPACWCKQSCYQSREYIQLHLSKSNYGTDNPYRATFDHLIFSLSLPIHH